MSLRVNGVATLTRDTEIRTTAKGGAWCNFGIATKRRNTPEGIQDVDFFEASYYLKNSASTLKDYLKKGNQIYLENAEMRADQYEKDGQKRTMNKVMIFTFDLLNTKGEKRTEKSPETPTVSETLIPEVKEPPVEIPSSAPTMGDDEDEIPF